jgi:hypothetical protein
MYNGENGVSTIPASQSAAQAAVGAIIKGRNPQRVVAAANAAFGRVRYHDDTGDAVLSRKLQPAVSGGE